MTRAYRARLSTVQLADDLRRALAPATVRIVAPTHGTHPRPVRIRISTPDGFLYLSLADARHALAAAETAAMAAEDRTRTAYAAAIAYAAGEGHTAGRAAGTWIIDGNTDERTATALLRGIEAGDPAVLDTLPRADLSGEWADGLTGPQLRDAALDAAGFAGSNSTADEWFTDICDAYESAFDDGMTATVVRAARAVIS